MVEVDKSVDKADIFIDINRGYLLECILDVSSHVSTIAYHRYLAFSLVVSDHSHNK